MDIQIARFSFPPKNSSLCLVDPGDRRHTGSGLAWRQTGRSYQWLFFFLLFFFPPCLLWFLFRVLWGWLVGWSYPGKEKTHLGWYILFIGFSMASSQFTGAGFFPWIIIKKELVVLPTSSSYGFTKATADYSSIPFMSSGFVSSKVG